MHSFTSRYCKSLSFSPTEAAALEALGEARGRQDLFARRRPEVLEALRQHAVVESVESSNRIEAITAPRGRIEGIVLHDSSPRDRPEQEIAGYRDALALIHGSHGGLEFTVEVLLRLHGMLYAHGDAAGGRFKEEDNEIVERAPDGRLLRIRFRPTSARETPAAMAALVAAHAEALRQRTLPPLVATPLAILDLLCIHPFADGNGRVARLAMLLLLYRQGFAVGRYVSLERLVEESRVMYYETLRESSQGWHRGEHDVHPWLNFAWGILLGACAEFEREVTRIDEGMGGKSGAVRSAILAKAGTFTLSEIARECPGVSQDLIRQVARRLRAEGRIALRNRGRGARWEPRRE